MTENEELDLSAGMVPHPRGGSRFAHRANEKGTFDGKTSVAASVPTEVNDLLDRTGAKITNNEAPTSKVVASVDPDEPNNINIDDKERFSKDKNAAAQTLSHEAVHVWHNNLPPEIQKMIPADDPKDPYHKNGYEPDELQNMRAQGLKLYNLPRERAATVIQKYSHLGGSNAPKEVRDVYEPWAKDMTTSPLSTVMPTSGNQQGINTDVRPPGSAPMPETQIFPEEKEKSEGNPEKSDGKSGPKHPAGDITGFDEETGLPIVKRKSTTQQVKPEAKPADPKEDAGKPAENKETESSKPQPEESSLAAKPKEESKTDSALHKPEPKEDVPAPKSPPKGEAEPEQKASEKSGAFKVGDKVTLPDGTGATVAYVPSKNSQLPTYRFKTDDGKTRELRTSQMGRVKPAEESADGKTPPPGHTVVTTHFRKLPNR